MSLQTIGELLTSPGQKIRGALVITGDHDPRYNPRFTVVNGVHPGKIVTLLGSTHGTEYASIDAVSRVIDALDPSEMSGVVVAVPVLNVPQFEARTQFTGPLDNVNLNDVFPGNPDGSFTMRLANKVFEEFVSRSDAMIDCHGGDVNEDIRGFVVASSGGGKELEQTSLAMASCFNTALVHVFPSEVPGMSNSAQTIYGIPCIQPEAGTPFPVREEAVTFHVDGVLNVLRYLGVLEGEPTTYNQLVSPRRLKLRSESSGSWHSHVELDQRVMAGDKLGVVTNHYGDVVQALLAPEPGIVSMKRCYYSVTERELLVVVSTLD